MDVFGFLLFYYVFGTIFFVSPIPFIISVIGLNPVALVLNNLYTRGQRDFSSFENGFLPCVVLTIFVYMYLRYVFIFLLILVLLVDSVKAGLYLTIDANRSKRYSERRLMQQYEMVLVLCSVLRNISSQNILYVITFTQMLLTICSWLVINCYGIMPAFITTAAFLALAGGLVYTIVLLTIFANIRIASLDFLRAKRQQFMGVFHSPWTERKLVNRRWQALRPLPIYCGRHFSLSKRAVMNYVSVLTSNVVNAVLLVEP